MRSIAPLLQRLLRLLFIGTPRGSASRIRCVDRPNTPCRVRVLSFDQRGVKSLAFRLGKFFVAQMADHPMPARAPCAAAGSTAITSPSDGRSQGSPDSRVFFSAVTERWKVSWETA